MIFTICLLVSSTPHCVKTLCENIFRECRIFKTKMNFFLRSYAMLFNLQWNLSCWYLICWYDWWHLIYGCHVSRNCCEFGFLFVGRLVHSHFDVYIIGKTWSHYNIFNLKIRNLRYFIFYSRDHTNFWNEKWNCSYFAKWLSNMILKSSFYEPDNDD